MEQDIFKNKKINSNKLLAYGFKKSNNKFVYSSELLNGDFSLFIEIKAPNILKTKLTENSTGEIYTLHLTNSQGDFVGKIREQYNEILSDILEKCFENDVFKFKQTQLVIEYIRSKYNDELEFLWKDYPNCAIARRKDNKKWYLIIAAIPKNKLGLKIDEIVEIIDLRADKEQISEILKQDNIYKGWHMNKKTWITIILDGSIRDNELCKKIDDSYILADK